MGGLARRSNSSALSSSGVVPRFRVPARGLRGGRVAARQAWRAQQNSSIRPKPFLRCQRRANLPPACRHRFTAACPAGLCWMRDGTRGSFGAPSADRGDKSKKASAERRRVRLLLAPVDDGAVGSDPAEDLGARCHQHGSARLSWGDTVREAGTHSGAGLRVQRATLPLSDG